MSDIVKPHFKPCPICDNTGWVCEGHGNHPWRGVSNRPDSCDFGPGIPCPSSTCEHSLDRRDDDDIAALRAEVKSKNEQFQQYARKMEAALNAQTAEIERLRADLEKARWDHNNTVLLAQHDNERLRAALSNIRHKRREMDMGDLSADEAVGEADAIASAALEGKHD